MNPKNSYKIMVVDDTETNIDILMETLGDTYEMMVATDGVSAIADIQDMLPDLVLLDIMMPDMDGFEVCRRLKADPQTKDIPVIFVTAMEEPVDEKKGLETGAVDYITKPFNPPVVKARVKNHLLIKEAQSLLSNQNSVLEQMVQERTHELEKVQDVTIQCMASLAETRDMETGAHIERTKYYVRTLARHLQNHPRFTAYLTDNAIRLLFKSAPLHDVGKVGVPDRVLLKPGKLTAEEFEEMKHHTVYGRDTLLSAEKSLGFASFLRFAREIAYTHHERWDGTGYPRGIRGEAIPVSGRLMAISDVYDALISKRIYKPAFTHEEAVHIITIGDGRVMPGHFDPDVLQAFKECQEDFRKIAIKYADTDEADDSPEPGEMTADK